MESYMVGSDTTGADSIAQEVLSKDLQLLELVEALGQYLTNPEKEKRQKGIKLLADVIHRLPYNFLSEKEVTTLTVFFGDRLKDHHSITPCVLHGLLALSNCVELKNDTALLMVRAIFKELHVQSLVQGDRRAFYTIMANFLSTRLTSMKSMGSDFIYGFVQAMDAEKDPRNLLLAFDCVQVIAKHFPLGVFGEELFEVVACYFPVDFSPPPNDPYGIKKEDLVDRLRHCMSASPKFAEHCLPLLLEKLTSTLLSAKYDSFTTLAECVEVYGAAALKEYENSFWSSIRREVFQSISEKVENSALDALRAMVRTIAAGNTEKGKNYHLENFLAEIIKESKRHLCEPDQRLAQPSATLLQAAASACEESATQVLDAVLPLLVEQFHKHNQTVPRKILQAMMKKFLLVPMDGKGKEVMKKHQSTLLPLFLSVLNDSSPDLRNRVVANLGVLVALPGVLDQQQLQMVGEHLVILVTQDNDPAVRQESAAALSALASHHPLLLLNTVIPKLQQHIKKDASTADSPSADRRELISVLVSMSVSPEITKISTAFLVDLLQQGSDAVISDTCTRFTKCICCGLQTITESATDQESLTHLACHVVPTSLCACVRAAMKDTGQAVLCDQQVLREIARFFQAVTTRLNANSCIPLVEGVIRLFLEGKNDTWIPDLPPEAFHPFQVPNSCPSQAQLIQLFSAIVCSVPKQVSIPHQDELFQVLFSMSTCTSDEAGCTAAAQCYGGLMNKFPSGSELDNICQSVLQKLVPLLSSAQGDNSQGQRALTLLSWVTKAMVIRGHGSGQEFTDQLLCCLRNPVLGHKAAEAFHIIMNETDNVMTPAMHADIRLMYRQRFFVTVLPSLVAGIKDTGSDMKHFYLLAISHLLKHVPKQVLSTELPKLMPLLVQSLLCEDLPLQLSTMTTMCSLISEAPSMLSTHVDSILPQLFKLAQYKPAMAVRIAALQCLAKMTNLPHPVVYPYQKKAIRVIGLVLDDHKRLVRREAVQARNEWFLLGTNQK